MAQQLKTSGEEVDLLLLLDSHFPGSEAEKWTGSNAVKTVGDDARRHLRNLVQRPLREQWTYVVVRAKNRLKQSSTKFAKPFRSLRCRLELALGRRIPPSLLSHYILGIYAKARVAYEPRRYSGRVIYVKSQMRSGDHRASWANIISEDLGCLEIPGDHLDAIKQPYVCLWAEKLTAWLSNGG
jgi:thioesterase domain-containing protein